RVQRHSLLPLLLAGCFSAGACLAAEEHVHDAAAASTQAQGASQGVAAAKGGPWSDPATWGGALPKDGDIVTIDNGIDIVLDVNTPALHGMNLNGKLSFADNKELELTTEWILMRGELHAGSESDPYKGKATITLTDNIKDENINGMGDRGIMIVGGTLSLHGDREHTWTKLAKTAEAGTDRIDV